nr:hypothetical protein [Campylobacter concisus]
MEEFIFWAKVDTKNQIVAFEEISFSKAMTLTPSPQPKFLCQIDAFKDENTTTLGFLNLHKDEIFDCFALKKVMIKNELNVKNSQVTNASNLKILPVRFMVEFKPKSAIIGTLQ